MKKTILPALAMLIISAVMLSTASYAWFAMSTEVAVNNMHVSITSDAANLVIAETKEAITTNAKYNTLSFDFNEVAAKKYLPTAFDATDKNGDTVTNESFTNDLTWYTMSSNDPEKAQGSGDKDYIPYAKIGEYALVKTFYIGVTAGSNDMHNLKAKVTIQNVAEAVNVLVVCTDTNGKFQNFETSSIDYTGSISLASLITEETPVCVSIYVYYNGHANNVNSVQLAGNNIDEGIVSVKFTASTTNP